jgi:DNA-binding transcriptional LysR family regulator
MDIKLLEAFKVVMENRSMTRAAKILGLTQPAVSAQIARLEAQVGFSLFSRTGGRLVPSDQGRQFFQEVLQALGGIDRLAQISKTIRSGRAGRLVIASHPSGSISILPDLVPRFMAENPDATIKMISRTSEGVRSVFDAASVDIGIAEIPIDLVGTEVRKYSLECVAILPVGHDLARREIINPADLSGLPFIAMAQGRLIGHRVRSAFVESGAEFNAIVESEYFSSICRLVAAGTGVAVVDCWSAHTFRPHGLEVRRFQPAITYEIGVFTSTERDPSELTKRFLPMLDAALTRNPNFSTRLDQ